MSREGSPHARIASLRDLLGRVRHDLGKYLVFQASWLPPEPGASELREALCADLLATRSGPAGPEDVLAVWSALRPGLCGQGPGPDGLTHDLAAHPRFLALEAAVGRLAHALPALRDGSLPDAALPELAASARLAAQAARDLHATFPEEP